LTWICSALQKFLIIVASGEKYITFSLKSLNLQNKKNLQNLEKQVICLYYRNNSSKNIHSRIWDLIMRDQKVFCVCVCVCVCVCLIPALEVSRCNIQSQNNSLGI
jgi:hypothetical protein